MAMGALPWYMGDHDPQLGGPHSFWTLAFWRQSFKLDKVGENLADQGVHI